MKYGLMYAGLWYAAVHTIAHAVCSTNHIEGSRTCASSCPRRVSLLALLTHKLQDTMMAVRGWLSCSDLEYGFEHKFAGVLEPREALSQHIGCIAL